MAEFSIGCKAASVAESMISRRGSLGVVGGVAVDDTVNDIGELGAVLGIHAVDKE